MLRFFVLLLLLANGGYYAWTQGWLQPIGYAPQRQGEPERLNQQIRPELLRVLPSNDAAPGAQAAPDTPAATPATPAPETLPPPATVTNTAPVAALSPTSPAGECLQAGVFDADEASVLRGAAASLPNGSWTLISTPLPGRWMVYMGKMVDEDAVAKKRKELRELGVPYDRPGAALEPGLSLGRFSSEEGAQRSLATLTGLGVRSARVVVERRELPGFTLHLPNADARLRKQVQALGGALAGKTLRPCG